MKTILRFLTVGLVLLALTGGWVYLYTNSHAVSAEQQNATLTLLKDFKQLDSDWNTDVLKAQAEIIRSYDPLIRPLAVFSKMLATLDAETKALGDADLQKSVADIRSAVDKKTLLIDQFKAQNSLLKNSLRYAPTAYKDIQDQMRSERDAGMSEGSRAMRDLPGAFDELEKALANNRGVNEAVVRLRNQMKGAKLANTAAKDAFTLVHLEGTVSALVGEALRYNSVPDNDTAENLKVGLNRMQEATPSFSPDVREPVENLMSHIEAIVRLRTTQTELLQKISQIPVATKIDDLGNALTTRFNAELTQQYSYQRLLLMYSAFSLLLIFGGAALIAYRNATERRRLTELVDKQTKELKENEVQLVHAQKMNALGEMVAGITHEVNTPLAAVKSGLQSSAELIGIAREYIEASQKLSAMLGTPTPPDEEARAKRKADLGSQLTQVKKLGDELSSFDALNTVDELMTEGMKNVDYIYQVVVNMLNFSRLDRSKISSVKVEEGIESTLVIAKHFLKKIKLSKHYGETKPVHCDIAQINQVLLNLIKNAAQAVSETGGEVSIETSMKNDKEVNIAVRDNGCGIPPDILSKIWEPFFTTKKAGSGTGLGLSTCKKIVASHGGRIDVTSTVGQGTTFTVTIPLAAPDSLYEEHGQEKHSEFLVTA